MSRNNFLMKPWQKTHGPKNYGPSEPWRNNLKNPRPANRAILKHQSLKSLTYWKLVQKRAPSRHPDAFISELKCYLITPTRSLKYGYNQLIYLKLNFMANSRNHDRNHQVIRFMVSRAVALCHYRWFSSQNLIALSARSSSSLPSAANLRHRL